MPPEPPQDPQKETKPEAPAPAPGQVDIDKILLPQKEVRKVESERRVSAGVLLDQEIKAGKEGLPKNDEQPRRSEVGAPTEASGKEESVVQPLETYQGAIEQVMRGSDVSVVSIAAAEAQRRAQKGREKIPEENAAPLRERAVTFFKKFSMVATGAILLGIAIAALAYVLLRPTTVPVAVAPAAPFIPVDETNFVVVSPAEPARDLIKKLDDAKKKVSLQLGLMARLIPSVSSTTETGEVSAPMDAPTFLSTVAPNIPANLLRTMEPTFLLGAHVYDANQPFLILRVDSYQEAFSGMLDWEFYMKNDLTPLFTYIPRQHIPEENLPTITTAPTTASSTPASVPSFIQPKFIDKIVENHDARVLQNDAGDIYLLWTFLDRNTLVITTNAATLREIISRLQNAPVTSIPTQ
jgi:hypothetical protein